MFIVIIKNPPNIIKGTLSLYLLEIDTGVFLGEIDSKTIIFLKDFVLENINSDSHGVFIYKSKKIQKFDFDLFGSKGLKLKEDFDNINLISLKKLWYKHNV